MGVRSGLQNWNGAKKEGLGQWGVFSGTGGAEEGQPRRRNCVGVGAEIKKKAGQRV